MKKRINFFKLFKFDECGNIETIKIIRLGCVQLSQGVKIGSNLKISGINLYEYVGNDFLIKKEKGVYVALGIY